MTYFKKIAKCCILFIMASLASSVFAAGANNPIGYWKTIDDKTGRVKSILKIWQTADNTLAGQVMKVFPLPGADPNPVCSQCKGAYHNKPILGMVILWGSKFDGKKWSHGEILDPKNGKVYSCNIEPLNNGANLKVHGYIGMPLLGRTQIWERVDGV